MLAGYPPFFAENPLGIYEKILAGNNIGYHFLSKSKTMSIISSKLITLPYSAKTMSQIKGKWHPLEGIRV